MRAALAGLVAACCLVQPAAAGAHAVLTHSTPHRDATVQSAPPQVVLDFNEPVGAGTGAVRVFGPDGKRIDDAKVTRPQSRSVAVGMPSNTAAGVYTATYRVVSADGHPVSGGVVFGIRTQVRSGSTGPTVEELLAEQESGAAVEAVYGVARAVHYAALLLLIGGVAFALAVWTRGGGAGRWPGAVLHWAALAGVAGALVAFPLQGLLSAGLGLGDIFERAVVDAAVDTRTGQAWLIRAGVWALLAVLLARRDAWSRTLTLAVAGAAAALTATLAWAGHAATQDPRAVLVAADVIHVLAAGAWLGGLVCLLVAFWRREPGEGARGATAAFSRMAVAAIAALVVAGTLEAWFYVGAIGRLFDGAYGLALLAKVALLGAVVWLGAANRRRVATWTQTSALRRAMRAEVLIAVGVLAATAVLVRAAPPVSIAEGPQELELVLGPMRMELVAEPAKVGSNAFHLYLFDRRTGAQVSRVEEVLLNLAHAERDLRFKVVVPRKGPAHYELLGQPLPAEGEWSLRVDVRVSDFDLYSARAKFEVSGD